MLLCSSRPVLRAAVLTVVIASVLVALQVYSQRAVYGEGETYVTTYSHADDEITVLLGRGDGQAYAQLARDPLLRAPEAFVGGEGELVYRAQRPVASYATWAAALGDPDRVKVATVIVTILGCGLLGGAVAELLRRRDVNPDLAVWSLLIPGVFASFRFLMPGALALGLGAAGLVAWEREERRPAIAALCFAGAVLTRETLLAIPVGLAIAEVLNRRRRPSSWLALPLAAYVGWWVIVRLLTGLSLFDGGRSGSRTSLPGLGLLDAMGEWTLGWEWFLMVVTVAATVAAVRLRPRDPLVWVSLTSLGVAMVMSIDVWGRWFNWSRAVTPAHLALVLVLVSLDRRKAEALDGPELASVV